MLYKNIRLLLKLTAHITFTEQTKNGSTQTYNGVKVDKWIEFIIVSIFIKMYNLVLIDTEETVAVNTIEWPPKIISKTQTETLSQSGRMTFYLEHR